MKDKFVFVELNYPKDKSELSAETINQNEDLKKKYPVQGFPTILLANADGKPFATTGYQAGGHEAYVKHLDELRAKKVALDESFAAAAKSSGVDKAKGLMAALAAMGLENTRQYPRAHSDWPEVAANLMTPLAPNSTRSRVVLSRIGNTPIIQLSFTDLGLTLFAKCEFFNPSGSMKDRFAKCVLSPEQRPGSWMDRNRALKGRNNVCRPFRAGSFSSGIPRALPWAGLFAHLWCSLPPSAQVHDRL